MAVKIFGKSASSQPISAHPAFPAIVALWFAALLGLGSLVLPIALFEKLASASGIASIMAAAEPPLGATARILLAALATFFGAAMGLFLARKIASAQAPAKQREYPATLSRTIPDRDPPTKHPISAHEELGSDYFDDPVDGGQAGKRQDGPPLRRAFAVTENSGPGEHYDEEFGTATVPNRPKSNGPESDASYSNGFDDPRGPDRNGAMDQIPTEQPRNFGQSHAAWQADEMLDLGGFAQEAPLDEPDNSDSLASTPGFPPVTRQCGSGGLSTDGMPRKSLDETLLATQDLAAQNEADDNAGARPFGMPSGGLVSPDANQRMPLSEASERFESSASAAPEALPTARFGMPQTIANTQGIVPDIPAEMAEQTKELDAQPEQDNAAVASETVSEADTGPETTSALSELGMAELLERFSRSLQNRASASHSLIIAPEIALEPAAEHVAESIRPHAPDKSPIPAALQPVGIDENDSDGGNDALTDGLGGLSHSPFTGAPKPFARPDAASDNPQRSEQANIASSNSFGDEADKDDLEGGYSSLLAIKRPIRPGHEFVRVDDEFEGDESDEAVSDEGVSDKGGDSAAAAHEPVVISPGQDGRRAVPAVDGPSRGPQTSVAAQAVAQPFAAPAGLGAVPQPMSQRHSQADINVDSNNEAALREALEKLQRMSNAS